MDITDHLLKQYAKAIKSGSIGQRIQANLDITKNAIRLKIERDDKGNTSANGVLMSVQTNKS